MTTAEQTGYAFKGGNIARWQRHRLNPIQRTPDAFFRKLDAEFRFTLDAAASPGNAKCARYFTREDDALGCDWGQERVWLNPPFGRGLREWARKAWEASRNGALVVVLVPSATDMDWWHDYVLEADEIRFIRGRMSFGSEDLTRNNYVFPVSLAIFRPRSTGERIALPLESVGVRVRRKTPRLDRPDCKASLGRPIGQFGAKEAQHCRGCHPTDGAPCEFHAYRGCPAGC